MFLLATAPHSRLPFGLGERRFPAVGVEMLGCAGRLLTFIPVERRIFESGHFLEVVSNPTGLDAP
jgi:hypothetical protein